MDSSIGTAAQKPWICAAFRALRGIGGAPKRYHLIAQPFSSAARTTPSSRAGARFEQVAARSAAASARRYNSYIPSPFPDRVDALVWAFSELLVEPMQRLA